MATGGPSSPSQPGRALLVRLHYWEGKDPKEVELDVRLSLGSPEELLSALRGALDRRRPGLAAYALPEGSTLETGDGGGEWDAQLAGCGGEALAQLPPSINLLVLLPTPQESTSEIGGRGSTSSQDNIRDQLSTQTGLAIGPASDVDGASSQAAAGARALSSAAGTSRPRLRVKHVDILPNNDFFDKQSLDVTFYTHATTEFIENSFQAGARLIDVFFDEKENEVRFYDNGRGMEYEELKLFAKYNLSCNFTREKEARASSGAPSKDSGSGSPSSSAGGAGQQRQRPKGKGRKKADFEALTNESRAEINSRLINGNLSRHGMGGKRAGFWFGDVIYLRTKPKDSQHVYCMELDNSVIRREGLRDSKLEMWAEPASADELAAGSFTRVTIRKCFRERVWDHYDRKTFCEFVYKKHFFYLLGGFATGANLDLDADSNAADLGSQRRTPVQVRLWDNKCKGEHDFIDVAGSKYNEVLHSQVRRLHDAIQERPKDAMVWRHELCTAVFLYFPCLKGKETMPLPASLFADTVDLEDNEELDSALHSSTLKSHSRVFLIWNGLYIENLDIVSLNRFINELNQLLFMRPEECDKKGLENKKFSGHSIPLVCYTNRVLGFVFLSPDVLPGTQKHSLTQAMGANNLNLVLVSSVLESAKRQYNAWMLEQHKRDQEVVFVDADKDASPWDDRTDERDVTWAAWNKIKFMGDEWSVKDVVEYRCSRDEAQTGRDSGPGITADEADPSPSSSKGKGKGKRGAGKRDVGYGRIVHFWRSVTGDLAMVEIEPYFPERWKDFSAREKSTKMDIARLEKKVKPEFADKQVQQFLPKSVGFLPNARSGAGTPGILSPSESDREAALEVQAGAAFSVGAQLLDGSGAAVSDQKRRAGRGVCFAFYLQEGKLTAESQAIVKEMQRKLDMAPMAIEKRIWESFKEDKSKRFERPGQLVLMKHLAFNEFLTDISAFVAQSLELPVAGAYRVVCFAINRDADAVTNDQDVRERRKFHADVRIDPAEFRLSVRSGPPQKLKLGWEDGRASASPAVLPLRSALPPITVSFLDGYGNAVSPSTVAPEAMERLRNDGFSVSCKEFAIELDSDDLRYDTAAHWLVDLKRAAIRVTGLRLKPKRASGGSSSAASKPAAARSREAFRVPAKLQAGLSPGEGGADGLAIEVVPGEPKQLFLLDEEAAEGLRIRPGERLPELRVGARDEDGFPCSSTVEGMHAVIEAGDAENAAATSAGGSSAKGRLRFKFDGTGVAHCTPNRNTPISTPLGTEIKLSVQLAGPDAELVADVPKLIVALPVVRRRLRVLNPAAEPAAGSASSKRKGKVRATKQQQQEQLEQQLECKEAGGILVVRRREGAAVAGLQCRVELDDAEGTPDEEWSPMDFTLSIVEEDTPAAPSDVDASITFRNKQRGAHLALPPIDVNSCLPDDQPRGALAQDLRVRYKVKDLIYW
eukprot:tig00020995_g16911.t1